MNVVRYNNLDKMVFLTISFFSIPVCSSTLSARFFLGLFIAIERIDAK